MPSGSMRRCPLEETRTGSTTSWGSRPARGQVGHHADDGGGGEHPGLHPAHGEVVEHGLDLLADERGLECHDAAHLGRVLRGHGGEGARAVHAVGREGLEVGLGAGAAARVGSGDGQRRRWGRIRHRATIGGHRGIVVR